MYTPDFELLYKDYFLPSIKDDFKIVAKTFPQDCPNGNFATSGWDKAMLHKLELLEEAIEDNWGKIFFYSDIDIVFLKPVLKDVLEEMGDKDLVIQHGWPRNGICAGFFAMRGNEQTHKLVKTSRLLLSSTVFKDDQTALEGVLNNCMEGEISWSLLPSDKFPNGRKVMRQTNGQYTSDSDIIVNPSALLFHATSCIGLENKYHFLRRVELLFQNSPPIDTLEALPGKLDVEKLPVYRSSQQPSAFNKIVIFSAPRTGSSLVYNVFRFLFEDDSKLFSPHDVFDLSRKVLKIHRTHEIERLDDENVLYVFTIRNPVGACLSNYRICTREISNVKEFAEEVISRQADTLHCAEKLISKGKYVLFFNYENFTPNLTSFLEQLENQFTLSIPLEDKMLMLEGYSKENIYSCTKKLTNFAEYLPISGFHGDHVSLVKYKSPEEFVYWINYYLESVKPLFQRHGYFQD